MADMTVGQLETTLFSAFPREDAEKWDQPGLAVGDPSAPVKRVAVNLDLTCEAVLAAAKAGCDVLVTHHPPFIKSGPTRFSPQGDAVASGPGRLVFEAARLGVSCIAMHTNADRSAATRERYAQLFGWECSGSFEQLYDTSRSTSAPGFGAVFELPQGATLSHVARKCKDTLGGDPRVWGSPELSVRRAALLNGSWGDPEVYDTCVANGIDCVLVGEVRYHFCLDARPHLAVVDMGHDISELPIVDVIVDALVGSGVSHSSIYRLDCSANNWWTL